MKHSPTVSIPSFQGLKTGTLSFFAFAFLAMCVGSRANDASLRSPWDSSPVKATERPYTCPAAVSLPVDFVTDGFYADNDPTHSIIDPVKAKAYAESSGAVKHDGDVVVAAADAYRNTGSLAAARCVIEHMEANAHNRSLTGKMSSNQAYYVQGWILGGEAIAYLKVRNAGVVSQQQASLILPWMQAVARQARDYYDARKAKGGASSQNNHYYWAGVELGAVGIAANDRSDFAWAIQAARDGIAQIRPDGTLPQEMSRGQRALHYHLYAVAPLVMIAEFGYPNGIDLYTERESALKRLVKVSTTGLVDPSLFEKAVGIAQEVPVPPTGEAIGWAQPYNRRFPDPVIAKLLAQCQDPSYMYLGGLPPQ